MAIPDRRVAPKIRNVILAAPTSTWTSPAPRSATWGRTGRA